MKARAIHTITIEHADVNEVTEEQLSIILQSVGIQKPKSMGWIMVMRELFEILEDPTRGNMVVRTVVETEDEETNHG